MLQPGLAAALGGVVVIVGRGCCRNTVFVLQRNLHIEVLVLVQRAAALRVQDAATAVCGCGTISARLGRLALGGGKVLPPVTWDSVWNWWNTQCAYFSKRALRRDISIVIY